MFSSKDIIGIEIGTQYLKLVQMNGSAEILNWITTDISALNDDAIADFISTYLKEKKIKTVEVINHIPAGNTITKNIELPATSTDEIKQIIKLQAGHYSPYSPDEIIIDYISLGVFNEGYTRIFLMIVKREDINRGAGIIAKAGLKLVKTVLSLETLVLWYKDQAANPLAVLHLDFDKADFLVIHKDKPIFLRNIPIGMGQLAYDKERYLPSLLEEIAHSIDAYQTDMREPMAKIIITGATAKMVDSANLIHEKHMVPVEVDDNFKELKLSSELQPMKDALADTSVISLAASVIKYPKTQLDLTPEEVKHQASSVEKTRSITLITVMVVIILLLYGAILVEGLVMKRAMYTVLDQEYQKLSKEAAGLTVKQSRLQEVQKYFQRRTFALDVLTDIYDKSITASENPIPDKSGLAALAGHSTIYLTGIVFNDERQPRVVIRGIAETNDDILKMVGRLEKSPFFKTVKTNSATARKELDRVKGTATEVVDFEVLCLFR